MTSGVRISVIVNDGTEADLGVTSELGVWTVSKPYLHTIEGRLLLFSSPGHYITAIRVDERLYTLDRTYVSVAPLTVM
jgi:hypothetical protein